MTLWYSLGKWAFLPVIKSLTDNYKFYDIETEHPEGEEQADSLKIETS